MQPIRKLLCIYNIVASDLSGDCVENLSVSEDDQTSHIRHYLPLQELLAHVNLGNVKTPSSSQILLLESSLCVDCILMVCFRAQMRSELSNFPECPGATSLPGSWWRP